VPSALKKNIESITQIEKEWVRQRAPLDRVSDTISTFAGSVSFVAAHLLAFVAWTVLNSQLVLGESAFDPCPYTFLNFVLAVEAVLLGSFVLMSQNRQNRQAEHWAHLDLQISLLAEQEMTKTLQLLRRISAHLGLDDVSRDKELEQMAQQTPIQVVARELADARQPDEPPRP
jgi:uncharacterized membrane protein